MKNKGYYFLSEMIKRRRICLEKRKRCIWCCVFSVLLIAVLIGVLYYFNDVRSTDQVSEGFLIWQQSPVKERVVSNVVRK